MPRKIVLFFFVSLSALPLSVAVRARAARSVWDGVYSADQAKRGETAYRQNCALCHGLQLTGTENAPGLLGDDFLKLWYGKSVADLTKQVQEKMPKDSPGILKPQQTVDILAHMFAVNKFPAGADELPNTPAVLSDIKIEKQPK